MKEARLAVAVTFALFGCGHHPAPANENPADAGVTMRAPTPRHCPGAIPASTLVTPGAPTQLAQVDVGHQFVGGIALSPSDVYFVVTGPSEETIELHKVPKTGGDDVDLGRADQSVGSDVVAADADNAYTSGYRYPTDGGAPVAYLDTSFVAIDDQHVFSVGPGGDIERSVKGSTDLATVATGNTTPSGLTTYGDWIYWVDHRARGIVRAPKVGGDTEILGAGGDTWKVVADCQEVFFSQVQYGDDVYAASLPPTAGSRYVAAFGSSYAIDDGAIYLEGPIVYRVNLDGLTPPDRIGFGESWPTFSTQIAVDERNVYWAADDGVWVARK